MCRHNSARPSPSPAARGGRPAGYGVSTLTDRVQQPRRGLTALNLDGLSRIEAVSSAAAAALGLALRRIGRIEVTALLREP